MGFAERLKRSPYYLVDTAKSQKPSRQYSIFNIQYSDTFITRRLTICLLDQVQRYSDRYNVVATKRPTLEAKDFEQKLFPKNVWTDYFEGKSQYSTLLSRTILYHK